MVTVALSGVCVEGCTADKAEEEEDALAMFSNANSEAAVRILLDKKATALAQGVKIFAPRLISLCARRLFFHVLSAALVKQEQQEKTSKEKCDGFSVEEGEGHRTTQCLPLLGFLQVVAPPGPANLH